MEKISTNPEELYQIIIKISVYECIAHLQLNLKRRSIVTNVSERAHSLFKKLLDSFSVNIIWGIIYSSIKSTSDYILKHKGTYKSRNESYLATVLYNKIESFAERALINNWDLTAFKRDFDLPQSSISRLVFNTILKTDDGGFTQKINSLLAIDQTSKNC
ncbi:MAG TPA: hypothetical protein VKR58_03365 [Aquella sp.]|nr:hypothetical protein [Aquella sp.]